MATNTMLCGLCRVVTATAPPAASHRHWQDQKVNFRKTHHGPSLESREPPEEEGDTAFGALGEARGCPSLGGQGTNPSVSMGTFYSAPAFMRASRDGH